MHICSCGLPHWSSVPSNTLLYALSPVGLLPVSTLFPVMYNRSESLLATFVIILRMIGGMQVSRVSPFPLYSVPISSPSQRTMCCNGGSSFLNLSGMPFPVKDMLSCSCRKDAVPLHRKDLRQSCLGSSLGSSNFTSTVHTLSPPIIYLS